MRRYKEKALSRERLCRLSSVLFRSKSPASECRGGGASEVDTAALSSLRGAVHCRSLHMLSRFSLSDFRLRRRVAEFRFVADWYEVGAVVESMRVVHHAWCVSVDTVMLFAVVSCCNVSSDAMKKSISLPLSARLVGESC